MVMYFDVEEKFESIEAFFIIYEPVKGVCAGVVMLWSLTKL